MILQVTPSCKPESSCFRWTRMWLFCRRDLDIRRDLLRSFLFITPPCGCTSHKCCVNAMLSYLSQPLFQGFPGAFLSTKPQTHSTQKNTPAFQRCRYEFALPHGPCVKARSGFPHTGAISDKNNCEAIHNSKAEKKKACTYPE